MEIVRDWELVREVGDTARTGQGAAKPAGSGEGLVQAGGVGEGDAGGPELGEGEGVGVGVTDPAPSSSAPMS